MKVRCKIHPEFQGKERPSTGCLICLEIYKVNIGDEEDVWEGWPYHMLGYAIDLARVEAFAAGELPSRGLDTTGKPWYAMETLLADKRIEEFLKVIEEYAEAVEDDEE